MSNDEHNLIVHTDDNDDDIADAVRASGALPSPAARASIRLRLSEALAEPVTATHVDWPSPAMVVSSASPSLRRPSRRWLAAGAALVVAAAAATTMVVIAYDQHAQPVQPVDSGPDGTTALPTGPVTLDQFAGRWLALEAAVLLQGPLLPDQFPTNAVPFLDIGMGSGVEVTIRGSDGCNDQVGFGSFDESRITVDGVTWTAMDCLPDKMPSTGVLEGDVGTLSADRSELTITHSSGTLRRTYVRLGSLAPADATTLPGRWTYRRGSLPGTFTITEDGSPSASTCAWGWTVDVHETTLIAPSDVPGSCSAPFADDGHGNPINAWIEDDRKTLVLSGDHWVEHFHRVDPTSPQTTVAPVPAGTDMVAGWPTAPAQASGFLAPGYLPGAGIPGAAVGHRTEHADNTAPQPVFTQVWAGGPEGRALLTITTSPGQHPAVTTVAEPFLVANWDTAYFADTSDPVELLVMDDPSGTVQLWATGISDIELARLANTMTARRWHDGVAGWDVAGLDSSLVPVHEGWSMRIDGRSIIWNRDGDPVAEMSILWGVPDGFAPLGIDGATALVDVNGTPAVAQHAGDLTSIVWSPQPDVTVVFGYLGNIDEALAIARTVSAVDDATWNAAAPPDPSPGDCTLLC